LASKNSTSAGAIAAGASAPLEAAAPKKDMPQHKTGAIKTEQVFMTRINR
jgi:hypothetical protein